MLLLLFATGWAANHFTAMLPALRVAERLSSAVLDGAFGVYALGLLPGLLGGGGLSDRVGRRPVVLIGATTAGSGNLIMLFTHGAAGIFVGRTVVGVGVGLAVSAGTAWAADLGGKRGTTLSGAILTIGFAAGPVVSGLLAQFLPAGPGLTVPFAVTVVLSLAVVAAAARAGAAGGGAPVTVVARPGPDDARRGFRVALAASVPMALWVFASVTVPMVTMVGLMADRFGGPWVPGMAAAVTLGAGVLIQVAARRGEWGAWAGVGGAALAAVGMCVAAAAGSHPSMPMFLVCGVVLGCAYGLCLREGLVDVETLAPSGSRGMLTGIFYVFTYLGFGLPLLLVAIRPAVGVVPPLLVLAAVAAVCAAVRAVHLTATDHLRR
ncbi:MFS transporter [Tsukamurella soli]|uniref:MFS transporter n=1 Tax=Tsukamurella soli TaxID=644556 RepID=A0ABP8J1S3_9ACTN